MKIVVGVPCHDEVKAKFACCLASMEKVDDTEIFFAIGNTCAESRDIISHYAMDKNADYVLFIDSDETFQPDVLKHLLSLNKEIVSGLVMHRVYPYKPVLFSQSAHGWTQVEMYPEDEPFKVDCSGGGACLLIKTDVFRKVYEAFGHIWSPMPETTEDLSFADRCNNIGIEWWCDPAVKIGHIAEVEITERIWKQVNEWGD